VRTLAALAVIAAVVAVGWAAAAGQQQAEFTTTLLASSSLDIGPRGKSIGDATIRKWRLSDRAGKAVGFGHEACRWTSSMLRLCVAVYVPPGGSIVVEGMVGDGSALAIAGGTGDYLAASGQAVRNGRTIRFEFTQ